MTSTVLLVCVSAMSRRRSAICASSLSISPCFVATIARSSPFSRAVSSASTSRIAVRDFTSSSSSPSLSLFVSIVFAFRSAIACLFCASLIWPSMSSICARRLRSPS